jgi:hypothetical protein
MGVVVALVSFCFEGGSMNPTCCPCSFLFQMGAVYTAPCFFLFRTGAVCILCAAPVSCVYTLNDQGAAWNSHAAPVSSLLPPNNGGI